MEGKVVEYIEAICSEISQPEIKENFLGWPGVKALMSLF